jgi:hypothetical protein
LCHLSPPATLIFFNSIFNWAKAPQLSHPLLHTGTTYCRSSIPFPRGTIVIIYKTTESHGSFAKSIVDLGAPCRECKVFGENEEFAHLEERGN